MLAKRPLKSAQWAFRKGNWFKRAPAEFRKKLARAVVEQRKKKYNVSRGMTYYLKELGISREGFRALLSHAIAARGKVSVLDVGFGEGKFLAQLKKAFGARIVTAGIGLNRPVHAKWVDELRVGLMEQKHFAQKFDLAFGVYSFEYSRNPALYLQNVYNSVREGGKIFLTVNANAKDHLPLFESAFMRVGATVRKIRNEKGMIIAIHLEKNSKRVLELSKEMRRFELAETG